MIKDVDIEGSYLFIVFKQNERLKFKFFLNISILNLGSEEDCKTMPICFVNRVL